jgi:sulfite exporter TauE/SafE
LENIDLLGFLSMGFFIGFGHCIGMCHPFVLYISGRFVAEKRGYLTMFIPHIKYNIGRITTYAILGLLAGFAGNLAEFAGDMAGIQKFSAILAGAFLVLYGAMTLFGYNLLNKLESKLGTQKLTNFIKRVQPGGAYTTGIILGFIPCGPLYGALIATMGAESPYKAMLSMALFGIGTMTALMITAVFGNFIMKRKGLFNILGVLTMTIMGAFLIYKALIFE